MKKKIIYAMIIVVVAACAFFAGRTTATVGTIVPLESVKKGE